MLNRTGWIFCSISLAVAGTACAVSFSLAALPPETIAAVKVPVPPETLPDIEIPAFGKVSILDLMGYYIDNPPAPAGAAGAAPAAQRFGGC